MGTTRLGWLAAAVLAGALAFAGARAIGAQEGRGARLPASTRTLELHHAPAVDLVSGCRC